MAQTQDELDDLIKKMVEELQKDLEVAIYGDNPKHERGLRILLAKLGIKSSQRGLAMESLDTTLRQVVFDDKTRKLWKP